MSYNEYKLLQVESFKLNGNWKSETFITWKIEYKFKRVNHSKKSSILKWVPITTKTLKQLKKVDTSNSQKGWNQ